MLQGRRNLLALAEEKFSFDDDESEMVFLPMAIKYQMRDRPSAKDNNILGLIGILRDIPNPRIQKVLLEQFKNLYGLDLRVGVPPISSADIRRWIK